MPPLVYIVLRQSPDWLDPASFRASIPAGFTPRIALWDATFSIPFNVFRAELKKLTLENLARVRGAQLAPLADVPDGAIVAPIDDDDWFSPELAEVLAREHRAGESGLTWAHRFLEIPVELEPIAITLARPYLFPPGGRVSRALRELRILDPLRKRLFHPQKIWTCHSNSYAMVNTREARPLLGDHDFANNWFEAHPETFHRIATALSVQNRTLASQTALLYQRRVKLEPRHLRAKRHAYARLYRRYHLEGVDWAKPYVARMADLMDALRRRQAR